MLKWSFIHVSCVLHYVYMPVTRSFVHQEFQTFDTFKIFWLQDLSLYKTFSLRADFRRFDHWRYKKSLNQHGKQICHPQYTPQPILKCNKNCTYDTLKLILSHRGREMLYSVP